MKTRVFVAIGIFLTATRAYSAVDLIEVAPRTNAFLTLGAPQRPQGEPLAKNGSGHFSNGQVLTNLAQVLTNLAHVKLYYAQGRTNSWFPLRRDQGLSSPGVEWAERINAEALRLHQQRWNEAQTESRRTVIPRLYPSKIELMPGLAR